MSCGTEQIWSSWQRLLPLATPVPDLSMGCVEASDGAVCEHSCRCGSLQMWIVSRGCCLQLLIRELEKRRYVPLSPSCHEHLRTFLKEHSTLQVFLDRHVMVTVSDGTPRYWVSNGDPLAASSEDTAPRFPTNVLNRTDGYGGQFLPTRAFQEISWGVVVSSEKKEALGGSRPWPLAGPERPIPKYSQSIVGVMIAQVGVLSPLACCAVQQ